MWITDKAPLLQSDKPNKIESLYNQIYYHDGIAYYIPRGIVSDGYTIPFNIDKCKRDVRPSMLHDIGCKFHQLIIVDLPIRYVETNYLHDIELALDNSTNEITVCKDIPIEQLRVVDVSFNKCNNLLSSSMVDANIHKNVCKLYRLAVNFNLNWLFTGKEKINLSSLYKDKIYT